MPQSDSAYIQDREVEVGLEGSASPIVRMRAMRSGLIGESWSKFAIRRKYA